MGSHRRFPGGIDLKYVKTAEIWQFTPRVTTPEWDSVDRSCLVDKNSVSLSHDPSSANRRSSYWTRPPQPWTTRANGWSKSRWIRSWPKAIAPALLWRIDWPPSRTATWSWCCRTARRSSQVPPMPWCKHAVSSTPCTMWMQQFSDYQTKEHSNGITTIISNIAAMTGFVLQYYFNKYQILSIFLLYKMLDRKRVIVFVCAYYGMLCANRVIPEKNDCSDYHVGSVYKGKHWIFTSISLCRFFLLGFTSSVTVYTQLRLFWTISQDIATQSRFLWRRPRTMGKLKIISLWRFHGGGVRGGPYSRLLQGPWFAVFHQILDALLNRNISGRNIDWSKSEQICHSLPFRNANRFWIWKRRDW